MGDPEGRWREAEAHILDFDPKQKGIYYNRLCFVNLATFDLDEECKSPTILPAMSSLFSSFLYDFLHFHLVLLELLFIVRMNSRYLVYFVVFHLLQRPMVRRDLLMMMHSE